MLRRLALLVAVLVVAGCGAEPPPQVTFAAGGADVVAGPTQYCDDEFASCTNDAAAPVDLAVPPGTPLVVTVPESIAGSPWIVVFTYRDGAGRSVDERTGLLTDQDTFTLELPAAQDRLVTAQVQQFGPPPEIDPGSGDIAFPIRGSWVLTVA